MQIVIIAGTWDSEVAAMTDILEFNDIYQEVKGSWVSRKSYKGFQGPCVVNKMCLVEMGEIRKYPKCINIVLSELFWYSSNWTFL